MTVGSNKNWTFQAGTCGPVLNMVPFPAGIDNVYPVVAIERNGKMLQTGNGSVAITQACSYENYNPVVGLAGVPIQASSKMGNASGMKGRPKKPTYQKSVC